MLMLFSLKKKISRHTHTHKVYPQMGMVKRVCHSECTSWYYDCMLSRSVMPDSL